MVLKRFRSFHRVNDEPTISDCVTSDGFKRRSRSGFAWIPAQGMRE
jgi:hypothetical protein